MVSASSMPRRPLPRRPLLRRAWRVLPVLATLGVLSGCEFAEVEVAPPAPLIVVHAVLNPDAAEQVVLVEASLTGRIGINDARDFNPLDPIRTAGGEPIAGAEVRLATGADTIGVRATETRIGTRGTGRYAVPRASLAIVPGQRYRLRVRTSDGRVATGETLVPGAPPGWSPGGGAVPRTTFARDSDSLRLTWPAVIGARTYAVRVETPYGPWALFSDSTRVTLDGTLRNFLAPGLPNVWYPGFRQITTVLAVDRNFYDYNRSGNDPFGGTGLISSVQGGIGLFGSLLELRRQEVTVTQRDRATLDAAWSGVNAGGAPVVLDLWVEDPGPRFSSVSGRVRTPEQFVVGTLAADGTLRLATLRSTSSADTAGLFTGRVQGDSITGTWSTRFNSAGPRLFRRSSR